MGLADRDLERMVESARHSRILVEMMESLNLISPPLNPLEVSGITRTIELGRQLPLSERVKLAIDFAKNRTESIPNPKIHIQDQLNAAVEQALGLPIARITDQF